MRSSHRTKTTTLAGLLLFGGLALSACSDIVENAVEDQLESELETGDVDIDLDSGEFSIEGADGEGFSVNLDEGGYTSRSGD